METGTRVVCMMKKPSRVLLGERIAKRGFLASEGVMDGGQSV
ncbi:MAG: hypothetical protein AB7D92_12265 [Sphaerochaeta sp.]